MRALSRSALSNLLGAIAVIFCTVLEPAHAAETTAFAMFEKGDYLAAAKAGAAEGGATSLALAARATLADATMRDAPCMECLQNAERLARQAIAADPNNMEGHIHLAVALGYQARIIGPLRARFARFPEQAKQEIETALRLAPNSHWALSAAGGFNIEVVRSGGRFLGNLFYGASFEDGVSYFQKAIAADPENPLIKLQYALALTGYAFDARRAEIAAVLDSSVHAKPGNIYEEAMRQRAGRLLVLLNENKVDDYIVLARRYQGFPN
jgi:tetratricopeptide (TPR) repeat protein